MSDQPLFHRLARTLEDARSPDGGFGPRAGLEAEPEPTALAAIALGDAGASAWLASRQRGDGSLGLSIGSVDNDDATAPAAIVLTGVARARALDHLEAAKASSVAGGEEVPSDPSAIGWSWTRHTYGWVEPTARAVLALRLLRPGSPQIPDGLALLAARECEGGGWNYGNSAVLGEELAPYAQTTAMALVALQGADPDLIERGRTALLRLWQEERTGGLSMAIATAAMRLHGDRLAAMVLERAMGGVFEATGFLGDTTALAWAAIAAGPGLERLAVAP